MNSKSVFAGAAIQVQRPIRRGQFHLHVLQNSPQWEGVRLISLQRRDAYADGESLPGIELSKDFDRGEDAFIDTAAIMQSFDLIITCDTSVAHLAGALGRPVWVVLKQVPDWRWPLERDDCPRYPSMRLFRQKERGGWVEVFSRVETALLA